MGAILNGIGFYGLFRASGSTFLVFSAYIRSRQDLPMLTSKSAAEKRAGTQKGAYTLVEETAELTHILLAAGSEVHLAVEAAKTLGAGCRVVSMPCMEVFEQQSDE